MPEFKLEPYKDWTPEQLKDHCRSLVRCLGNRDKIIRRIWLICHRPSKDHPKGNHAYSHFMADFDEIRELCRPVVEPYLDDDDQCSAPNDPNYKWGLDYGKDLLKDINQLAHTAGTNALQRDVLQRAYREIKRLSGS